MHYIQKHILDELRTTETVRYAQLNPDEIESGHFRYHLTQLIRDGYVEQVERGLYRLTQPGQHAVDKLSANRVNPVPMPKVITYTLLRDADTIFLQQKSKQPYMGLLNMIGGKLHESELAAAAAIREVSEKTGTTITDPALRGVFEILISSSENLLTHVIAYVFEASINAQTVKPQRVTPIDISQLARIENLAPDFMPIFNRIMPIGDQAPALSPLKIHWTPNLS